MNTINQRIQTITDSFPSPSTTTMLQLTLLKATVLHLRRVHQPTECYHADVLKFRAEPALRQAVLLAHQMGEPLDNIEPQFEPTVDNSTIIDGMLEDIEYMIEIVKSGSNEPLGLRLSSMIERLLVVCPELLEME